MSERLSPVEAAAIFARLTEAGWLTFAPPADDPLLIGPARLAKLLDISTRAAAFRMRAGLFGPLIMLGRDEPRVRLAGVHMWLDEEEARKEAELDEQSSFDNAPETDRRGGRAGEHLRTDRRTDTTCGQPGQGPSRIIAVAPRGARTAAH